MAHIIVVGNEKGGAGKSTVSMHVATALARMGHKIGTLDLDLRQKTLGRYITNRRKYLDKEGLFVGRQTIDVTGAVLLVMSLFLLFPPCSRLLLKLGWKGCSLIPKNLSPFLRQQTLFHLLNWVLL